MCLYNQTVLREDRWAHRDTVVLVVGVLRVRLLPFLSVAVVVVITWVQGFLGLVDEAAAAADRAQGQLGHRGEQGGPETRPLGGDKVESPFRTHMHTRFLLCVCMGIGVYV